MTTKKSTKPVNKKPKASPGKPRNVKNVIPLGTQEISVYASPKVSKALDEITEDMTLYHGVRLSQILEAVYSQGQKDGARSVFDNIESKVIEAKAEITHRNPGQPKKPKKAPAKKAPAKKK